MVAYASVRELASRLGMDGSYEDDALSFALDVAQDEVNSHCGRSFDVDTTVTVRVMQATDPVVLWLPSGWDISTKTGLLVATDDNDSGTTFETSWTIETDFVCADGAVQYNGRLAQPWTKLIAVGSKRWPYTTYREAVQITAKFGWASVPVPVKQATLILAAEAWKIKDAPFGVAAFGDFGPIRVRSNPMVAALLRRYRHPRTAAVVA